MEVCLLPAAPEEQRRRWNICRILLPLPFSLQQLTTKWGQPGAWANHNNWHRLVDREFERALLDHAANATARQQILQPIRAQTFSWPRNHCLIGHNGHQHIQRTALIARRDRKWPRPNWLEQLENYGQRELCSGMAKIRQCLQNGASRPICIRIQILLPFGRCELNQFLFFQFVRAIQGQ